MNTENNDQPARPVAYRDYYPADEISLIDLMLIIMRRWAIGLTVFLWVLAIAIGYLFGAEKQYTSSAVISIGTMGRINPNLTTTEVYLEDPELLIRRIKQQMKDSDSQASISDVSLENKRFVNLKAVSPDPSAARQLLDNKLNELVSRHEQIYASIANEYKRTIERLQAKLAKAESSEDTISIADTQSAILTLRIASSEPVLSRTQVIQPPNLPVNPSVPRYKLVIAVSIVLGIVLSMMAIFIAEFISNVRRELRQRNQHQ